MSNVALLKRTMNVIRLPRPVLALLAVALMVCASVQPAAASELYAYKSGSRGTITFTSTKPVGKDFWVVDPRKPSFTSRAYLDDSYRWIAYPRPSSYDVLIQDLARAYQLEPALVKAVVHVESAFNPRARSHAGAAGLMQLMPGTANRFGVRNVYQPADNVLGGIRYLRWLFTYFDGNVPLVLAGYNAGEGAVNRYGGVPPYRETQTYVRRVLRMRDVYRCDYAGKRTCQT